MYTLWSHIVPTLAIQISRRRCLGKDSSSIIVLTTFSLTPAGAFTPFTLPGIASTTRTCTDRALRHMSTSNLHSRVLIGIHGINSSEEDVSENSPLLRSQSRESGSSRSSLSTDSTISYQIPPPDHGKAAWSFLAGCFLIEGLIWGES